VTVISPSLEVAEVIIEAGGEALKSCYQCGLCTAACPWNLVRSFLTRRLIHESQIGLVELENEDIWLCATCNACVSMCPRGVQIIDIMRALRRIGTEWGVTPKSLHTVLTNIQAVGNPQGEPRENRTDWAKDLNVKTFTVGTEYLYVPCCTPIYEPKARRMALAAVNVLKKARVDFGILGSEESCCGESARKAGEEELFQNLMKSNIEVFKNNGVNKIIVSSPHCYHSFRNEYPEAGGDFEVMHVTKFLAGLIESGNLKMKKSLDKKVAYHDPCYLGRHNNVYDEPRKVLKSIPGIEFVELPDARENSLCCGGGGSRIWQETKKEERFSDIRIDQALEVGAEVLAIACPYCMLNFDDSLLSMNREEVLEIRDIMELVNEVI